MMNKYTKPYPTIGALIKDKNYDYVDYRIIYPDCDDEKRGEFIGCFKVKDGKIIPLDGDIYEENESVIASEEWTKDYNGEKINGLTVVVEAALI